MQQAKQRLPQSLSSFLGRQPEIATLLQWLAGGKRLITLTGPGGTGKTRLALQTASQAAGNFIDGVFFIPLEGLAEPDQVLPALASVLEIPETGERAIYDDLQEGLAETEALLVLDNCEHVLGAMSQVGALLQACPRLQLLATSREALRLSGEHEFPVPALPLPDPDQVVSPELLNTCESVQLFLQRAAAIRPGLLLDQANAEAVVHICRLLDGLPLAIELVAVRVRLFTPAQLLEQLQRRSQFKSLHPDLNLLASGSRDLASRHRTLQNTIDWSYQLLDASQQRLFRSLAVFAGEFTLEAAQAVAPVNGDLLAAVEALVEKNLLQVAGVGPTPRFGMLKTIQAYAYEQLAAAGEAEAAARALAHYLLQFARQETSLMYGPEMQAALQALEAEDANFQSALYWAEEQGEAETVCQLVILLWRLWWMRGRVYLAKRWLEAARSLRARVPPSLELQVLAANAKQAFYQTNYAQARRDYEECLVASQKLGDSFEEARTLLGLGMIALRQGDFEAARQQLEQSLAYFRRVNDETYTADTLNALNALAMNEYKYGEARTYAKAALEIYRDQQDVQGVAGMLTNLALLHLELEEYKPAIEYAQQGLHSFEQLEDRSGIGFAQKIAGWAALLQGNLAQAHTYLIASLQINQELGVMGEICQLLEACAILALERAAPERAAKIWGAAHSLREQAGSYYEISPQSAIDRKLIQTKPVLEGAKLSAAYSDGQHLAPDAILALVLETQSEKASTASPFLLTKRESEILRLVALGFSDKEIAEKLYLSPRTINAHLTTVYSKLGVSSRAAATRFAVDEGLV